MPINGADVVSKNIAKFGGGFIKELNRDMEQVRLILDKAVEKNISLADHSQADLAAMGHPYSVRAPQAIHSPGYQVHEQSGRLRAGKYSGTEKAEASGVDFISRTSFLRGKIGASAFVGINESVRHAFFVVFGTSKMVPRDFLIGSLGEVREQAFEILRRSLNGFTISFNGEKVKL